MMLPYAMSTRTTHSRPLRRAVILTALPVEYQAVREFLRSVREEVHPEGTVYERGLFASKGQAWEVLLVQTGANNQQATLETERALRYFSPDVALFVGVAGGLKDVRIGDVVAASKVYGYESGKAVLELEPRPDVGQSNYDLVQRAQAVVRAGKWPRWLLDEAPPQPPRALVGAIAAGEKVLADTRSAVHQFLRKQYSDALAVEMEGRGFLTATQANRGVQALVIRGISDLIDSKTEADASGSQELASRHASAFAFELLAEHHVPIRRSATASFGETLREWLQWALEQTRPIDNVFSFLTFLVLALAGLVVAAASLATAQLSTVAVVLAVATFLGTLLYGVRAFAAPSRNAWTAAALGTTTAVLVWAAVNAEPATTEEVQPGLQAKAAPSSAGRPPPLQKPARADPAGIPDAPVPSQDRVQVQPVPPPPPEASPAQSVRPAALIAEAGDHADAGPQPVTAVFLAPEPRTARSRTLVRADVKTQSCGDPEDADDSTRELAVELAGSIGAGGDEGRVSAYSDEDAWRPFDDAASDVLIMNARLSREESGLAHRSYRVQFSLMVESDWKTRRSCVSGCRITFSPEMTTVVRMPQSWTAGRLRLIMEGAPTCIASLESATPTTDGGSGAEEQPVAAEPGSQHMNMWSWSLAPGEYSLSVRCDRVDACRRQCIPPAEPQLHALWRAPGMDGGQPYIDPQQYDFMMRRNAMLLYENEMLMRQHVLLMQMHEHCLAGRSGERTHRALQLKLERLH